MIKYIKNEKGLSLVELLTVLAIGSIVLLFISTVHIFIQNQFNSQSKDVKELTDVTVAMRAITKDLRVADKVTTSEHLNELIIDDQIVYLFEDNILKKNGASYIYEVRDFVVENEDSKIRLEITSQSGKKVKTEIVMREVDE